MCIRDRPPRARRAGRLGPPRPAESGKKGMKNAKGRYNGYRGECGPRLPDEGRAAGGPRSANADLYPPCAVNSAAALRASVVAVLLAVVVAA